jgi:hypothetical protein
LLLAVTACTPAPQPLEPIAVEAGYRLLFNGNLVGNALFALHLEADGTYLIEAFTVPAGQMQQTGRHEILESSRGSVGDQGIRPQRFEHSVMQDGRVEAFSFVFDWEAGVLRLIGGKDGERTVGLLPGTHDRLSYLLAARQLAVAAEGILQIQIASPDSAEKTRLEVMPDEVMEIPLGRYQATGIRRVSAEPNETRALWFNPGLSPLPLRVVRTWGGNTAEMQLESLSPGHPR